MSDYRIIKKAFGPGYPLQLTAKGTFETHRTVGVGGFKEKSFKTQEGARRWIDARSFNEMECLVIERSNPSWDDLTGASKK
jgi:hypothetical protein